MVYVGRLGTITIKGTTRVANLEPLPKTIMYMVVFMYWFIK